MSHTHTNPRKGQCTRHAFDIYFNDRLSAYEIPTTTFLRQESTPVCLLRVRLLRPQVVHVTCKMN